MNLDYREYGAIRYLLMVNSVSNENDLLFLEYRLKGITEAATNLGNFISTDEQYRALCSNLIDSYRTLVLSLYDRNLWQRCICLKAEDQLFFHIISADKLLDVRAIDANFYNDFLSPVIEDLVNFFRYEVKVRKGQLDEERLKILGYVELKRMNLIECMRNFKHILKELEDLVQSRVINKWMEKPESVRGRYILVNSATRVSDVLRWEDTISVSVIDVLDPHWYQEDERKVLFVYEVNAEQIVGMFREDASTYYFDCNSLEGALCQLLTDDGLESKRSLGCNVTGYRPAYSLDELISKEGAVSEVVLKGSAKPIGILLADDNHYGDALSYANLVSDVPIHSLRQYQEMIKGLEEK